jgi:hypothetical protein
MRVPAGTKVLVCAEEALYLLFLLFLMQSNRESKYKKIILEGLL